MTKNVTMLEEFDLSEKLQFPHFSFARRDVITQKRLAYEVLIRKADDILLVTSNGFEYEGVLAGLSEKHIEHIAKNGPRDYKENILKILKDKEMMQEFFEIAKAMDDDLGRGSVRHQERVKNVVQYIKDNQVAFEF